MPKVLSEELMSSIKKNSYEKPDFIVEDIETVSFKERAGSLIVDRSYQRNFIQNQKGVSRYVESVFLGLTIPEIQVYENYEKGYREIIDGQQRTLSLIKFLRGEYSLKGLEFLPQLNGMFFKDLPPELQTIYKQFGINMRVAKNPAPDYKFLLFERLNLGSKPLNPQEIRNCMFKENPILAMTRTTVEKNDSISTLFGQIGGIKNNRFAIDELILNILSLSYGDVSLERTIMKNRINSFLEDTRDVKPEYVEEMFTKFLDITDMILDNFDPELFRTYSSTKTLLESIYVAIFAFDDLNTIQAHIRDVELEIERAIKSPEFADSMSLGESKSNKEALFRSRLVLRHIRHAVK